MISMIYLFEGKIIEHIKRNKGRYALGAVGSLGAVLAAKLGHDDTPIKKIEKVLNPEASIEPNNTPVKKIGSSLKRKIEVNPDIAAAKKLKAELKRKADANIDYDNYVKKSIKNPYNNIIDKAAQRHNVDPKFIKSIIGAESGFNHKKISKAGAVGLMQIMPETAKQMKVDPHDPVQNVHGGTKYLASLLKKYNGNKEAVAAAYNGGDGRFDRHGQDLSKMPRETKRYVPKVMRNYAGKDYEFNKT